MWYGVVAQGLAPAQQPSAPQRGQVSWVAQKLLWPGHLAPSNFGQVKLSEAAETAHIWGGLSTLSHPRNQKVRDL